MIDSSALQAEAIAVRVNGRSGPRDLIRDITLALAPGEFVAVIGPNGAGKSTLLGALAGDRPVARGRVLLDGHPLPHWGKTTLAHRRAVLPQSSSVAFDFTGRQVALLGLLAHRNRLSEQRMAAIVEAALQETEAQAFADQPYSVLSGGERQRVQLARVLAQCDADPGAKRYLLLDEPISGLVLAHEHDGVASAGLRVEGWLGVLAVLHDLTMAARYADRVAILEQGALVACGPARATLDPALLSKVFATQVVAVEGPAGPAFIAPG
jgi:iron complex transport system ATP-binding protein